MAYCAQDDIAAIIGMDRLIKLTDTDKLGEVDEAKVTKAITKADALIDTYLINKVSVPVSPVPDVVKDKSEAIAIYYLHVGKGLKKESFVTERDAYLDALKWLENFSKGIVSIGPTAAPPTESSPSASMSNKSATSDYRTKLDTFMP